MLSHVGETVVDVTVAGDRAAAAEAAAAIVVLALRDAGASVEHPGIGFGSVLGHSLNGAHVVIRIGWGRSLPSLALSAPRGPPWGSFGRIALYLVLVFALLSAELRARLGLRLDVVITAAAFWWFWRRTQYRNKW
ncbi:hypothetical protein AcidC75_32610 [Acidisoma sp. C75]